MLTKIKLKTPLVGNESAQWPEQGINYSVPASKRGLDMLLNKVKGRPYQSEVIMVCSEENSAPVLKKQLCAARIALVTDGGLVPKGNPDFIPPTNANKFCIYSIAGQEELSAENYEVSHQGYDGGHVQENPNRLMPVDSLREAEKEGLIGKLWDLFYTTTGVMTSVENSTAMGKKIAVSLKSSEVDAVILVSTCGTSTRCGALIAKEIEKQSMPVVQVTNLTQIAEGLGVKRVMKGNNICYAFGKPELGAAAERQFRKAMIYKILEMFTVTPAGNDTLVWSM